MDRAAVDFTSAHYLGLRHSSATLAPWAQLSTGRPAALCEPKSAQRVAARLSALQGLEAGVLGPSTLHLMWDQFGAFAREGRPILVDEGAYAISHWGAEHAKTIGAHVETFGHHDLDAARHRVRALARGRAGPAIVVDGFCVGCGKLAPVGALVDVAHECGGVVLCDDTQAFGILGYGHASTRPYGIGGGGTPAWSGCHGDGLIVIASLAKGFSTPVAALSGCRRLVDRFLDVSETRVHCSAPSLPVILAAERALGINALTGERLRARLCRNVRQFRSALIARGVSLATNGLFPVQSLGPFERAVATAMHETLSEQGVRSVLTSARCGSAARLTFLITARHRAAELHSAAWLVARVIHTKTMRRQIVGS